MTLGSLSRSNGDNGSVKFHIVMLKNYLEEVPHPERTISRRRPCWPLRLIRLNQQELENQASLQMNAL
jgi:hypothetical protein